MGKFELFVRVIMPIVSCLQVYGIFIAARIPKAGWDIKGLLMVLCLVLPGLGFLITVIVWAIRYRRLKTTEKKEQKPLGIPPAGSLSHYRLFLFIKEFTLIMVSFIIGKGVTGFVLFNTLAHINDGISDYEYKQWMDSSIRRDSMIKGRRDSATHRYLDSIIQIKIDSLHDLRKDSMKMLRRNLMN